jgi:hypothetical protein
MGGMITLTWALLIYGYWSPSKQIVIHDSSVEDVAKATGPIQSQLEGQKRRADELKMQLDQATQTLADARRQLESSKQQKDTGDALKGAAPQAVQANLSPEEIATKISIWESVSGSHLNALVGAYNALDLAQSRWTQLAKSSEGRRQLYEQLVNADAAFVGASTDLEALRSAYPSYLDVANALAQQPRVPTLHKAALDFANAIIKDGASEIEVRPLAGALRREMDSMQIWMHDLRVTANQQHKILLDRK